MHDFGFVYVYFLQKNIVGITYRAINTEHIARSEACVIASNHQSLYETLVFSLLIKDCTYILKKELFFIPIFGWYLKKSGVIAIDRKKGIHALSEMKKRAINILKEEKRTIIIFPEGTRVNIGEKKNINPGVFLLYQIDVDFFLCKHNAGLSWAKKNYPLKKGMVTLTFEKLTDRKKNKKELLSYISEHYYG